MLFSKKKQLNGKLQLFILQDDLWPSVGNGELEWRMYMLWVVSLHTLIFQSIGYKEAEAKSNSLLCRREWMPELDLMHCNALTMPLPYMPLLVSCLKTSHVRQTLQKSMMPELLCADESTWHVLSSCRMLRVFLVWFSKWLQSVKKVL